MQCGATEDRRYCWTLVSCGTPLQPVTHTAVHLCLNTLQSIPPLSWSHILHLAESTLQSVWISLKWLHHCSIVTKSSKVAKPRDHLWVPTKLLLLECLHCRLVALWGWGLPADTVHLLQHPAAGSRSTVLLQCVSGCLSAPPRDRERGGCGGCWQWNKYGRIGDRNGRLTSYRLDPSRAAQQLSLWLHGR